MKANEYQISSEKFIFAQNDKNLRDKELDTKPISYLHDAFNRFKRNKASIAAAIIIGCLILFAIFGPIFSPYTVAYNDTYYAYAQPRNELFYNLGFDFWDGCAKKKDVNQQTFYYYQFINEEIGLNPIKNGEYKEYTTKLLGKTETKYEFRLDTYYKTGVVFKQVTPAEYAAIQAYQDEHNVQIIYPITTFDMRPVAKQDNTDANFWYKTKTNDRGQTVVVFDDQGNPVNIYVPYSGKDPYTSKMRIEGDTPKYDYARSVNNGESYEIRINYYEYYQYYHAVIAKDGIKTPSYLFGATQAGKDIFTCLSSGARFSFILAIIVASVNLFFGAIYGAIEGYYGGKLDIIMERICDILGAIPFMIVISLLKFHFVDNKFIVLGVEIPNQIVILFISFFLTGWIGMAARTRMQFYRFKNQEYVMAARTLGAKDMRIMFKHIFPNALGTLITGCVLIIPSMIFSETNLSYLGIINLETGNLTSVGTLLSSGQKNMMEYPHMVFFPAVYISLLMLSFNLFGNGLRDAFNPSLRGAED